MVLFIEVLMVGSLCELRRGGDSGFHDWLSTFFGSTLLRDISLEPHLQPPNNDCPPKAHNACIYSC